MVSIGAGGPVDARFAAFLSGIPQLRPRLHRYCARMTGSVLDGEDVVQEALLAAFTKLDGFDDGRPLEPWLFRIAHNRCIDFIRQRTARTQSETAAHAQGDLHVDPVEPSGPAAGRALEHLVLNLPPLERACVLLKDVLDYSLEEIAPMVESTVGGVKAALHRGRAKLAVPAGPMPTATWRTAPGDTSSVIAAYVERFNRHDWDGLRELITTDARLRVADRYRGLLADSPYFGRYAARKVAWRVSPGEIDGEPVVFVLAAKGENNAWQTEAVVRLTIVDGYIHAIADYTHCPWVLAAAESRVIATSP